MNLKTKIMISSLNIFFFPTNITSVLFALSISQLLFNHMSLLESESSLGNHTHSKKKNCGKLQSIWPLISRHLEESSSWIPTWDTEARKGVSDLLTLQSCLFDSDSLATQLCSSTSVVPKEPPPKYSNAFLSSPGQSPCHSHKNQFPIRKTSHETWYFLWDLPLL